MWKGSHEVEKSELLLCELGMQVCNPMPFDTENIWHLLFFFLHNLSVCVYICMQVSRSLPAGHQ